MLTFKVFSVGLGVVEPISVLLVLTKAGSHRCEPPLETTDEEEDEEEATVSF